MTTNVDNLSRFAVVRPRTAGRCHGWLSALLGSLCLAWLPPAVGAATPIRVGPTQAVKSLSAAASMAKDGDIFEVDAGDYIRDVAVWTKDNITVRAVGGRVHLVAGGMAAEGKGTWVIRGRQMSVQGFDFSGSRVPDKNGAGIRLEKGTLSVSDCKFTDNENGILTSNNPTIELTISNSEFGHNGHGDGQSHNMYVGEIARLTVTGSYFHHAKVGHLLKTRAAENYIYYNRLTDEIGGTASYELEFPNGGLAYVVGNIVQQGSQTQNPHIISYGAEGYKWSKNGLFLVNNTLVDNRPTPGVFLRVKPGDTVVKAYNNLLLGTGSLDTAGPGEYRNNFTVDWDQFAMAAREDYRLTSKSKLRGKAIEAGKANSQNLMPEKEYVHPHSTVVLKGPVLHPGALQSLK